MPQEYVYFLRCRNYIKIGCSAHPLARLRKIRCTTWHMLRTKEVRMIGAIKGSIDLEEEIQNKFSEFHNPPKLPKGVSPASCGGRMDWFRADPKLLAEIESLRPQFVLLESMRKTYPRHEP